VIQIQGAPLTEDSNQPKVERGDIAFGMKPAEKFSWQHNISSHAIKNSRRYDLPRQTAAKARHSKHNSHSIKKKGTPNPLAYIEECCIHIRKTRVVRPDTLSEINLQSPKDSCQKTDKHSGKRNCLLW